MENQTFSTAEEWQAAEDERLEYEGYCNKIRKGLEDLDENSGERAIWELVQNARDISDKASIKIELTDSYIKFSHHGRPFDYTSFRALVKQDSSKDRNGTEQAGQYGTGFMTTHAFNRMVYISGPYEVKIGEDSIIGYVQLKDFELDRTLVETKSGPAIMKNQLEQVKKLCQGELLKNIKDETTSFRYNLDNAQIADVSRQLSKAIKLMPFVLSINSRINDIEIVNHIANEHFSLSKSAEAIIKGLDIEGWHEVTQEIARYDSHNQTLVEIFSCMSLQSDNGDVILIPPFPDFCGSLKDIPSLFLWFPLLGTETFGVNFIFHSKRFYPVEKRNNILLPGSTVMKREYGGKNSAILKEMFQVLFSYFSKDENARKLSREMCEVSFPTNAEDDITREFYAEMQLLWNSQIQNWKILPVKGGYFSISNPNVKVLHPDFYSRLSSEQKKLYEPILSSYALLPLNYEGNSYLFPETKLIAWSEVVAQWNCKRDDFYITISDICNAIQTKGEDLHSFLMLLKDSGNEKFLDDYPLLPNRNGKLRKKTELYHGDFLTKEIYDLVKGVMGDDADKIFDTAYLDVCDVNLFSKTDLRNVITSTMGEWRKEMLSSNSHPVDMQQRVGALIKFCSASGLSDFNNTRSRMMPLIAHFFGTEYEFIPTIKFTEDKEEDFYATAFNLLLDYTLSQISQKDEEWVLNNKDWLKAFLFEYSPSTSDAHKKRLNDYAILPNSKGKLCMLDNLRLNNRVPEEMAEIYRQTFDHDLYDIWIDPDFVSIIQLQSDTPEEIAGQIDRKLNLDMDAKERNFDKIILNIILKISESSRWKTWFPLINSKKELFTFSMKSGDAQKSLFSLMSMDDGSLSRLASLGEKGDIEQIIDQMEHLQELQYNKEARFYHLYMIGKHIENELREKIKSDLIQVDKPSETGEDPLAQDIQDGQDIVVRVKKEDKLVDVFYIEVKSKWDFSEPAHMSTRQVRQAALNPDKYALCCVDLRKYKDEDLKSLPLDKIIECTRVKMEVGSILNPLMKAILEADNFPDDEQIKISEYRSNMNAHVFESGTSIDVLIKTIEKRVANMLK